MRHDDAERAVVEQARRDRILAVRNAHDRRDPGIERRERDLRRRFDRKRAVLEIDEQPVVAGARHRLGDLDRPHDPDADAERQFAPLELFPRNVANRRAFVMLLASSPDCRSARTRSRRRRWSRIGPRSRATFATRCSPAARGSLMALQQHEGDQHVGLAALGSKQPLVAFRADDDDHVGVRVR